jgi:hypothetical protein
MDAKTVRQKSMNKTPQPEMVDNINWFTLLANFNSSKVTTQNWRQEGSERGGGQQTDSAML